MAYGPVDKLIASRLPRPAKVETSPWWFLLRPLQMAWPTRHCCLSTPPTSSQLASKLCTNSKLQHNWNISFSAGVRIETDWRDLLCVKSLSWKD